MATKKSTKKTSGKKMYLYQIYNRRNGSIYGYFRGTHENEIIPKLQEALGLDEEATKQWLHDGIYDIRRYEPGNVEYCRAPLPAC